MLLVLQLDVSPPHLTELLAGALKVRLIVKMFDDALPNF